MFRVFRFLREFRFFFHGDRSSSSSLLDESRLWSWDGGSAFRAHHTWLMRISSSMDTGGLVLVDRLTYSMSHSSSLFRSASGSLLLRGLDPTDAWTCFILILMEPLHLTLTCGYVRAGLPSSLRLSTLEVCASLLVSGGESATCL